MKEMVMTRWRGVAVVLVSGALLAGCSSTPSSPGTAGVARQGKAESSSSTPSSTPSTAAARPAAPVPAPFRHPLPGMPPIEGAKVYAAGAADRVEPRLRHDRPYLYVPNSYGAPRTTVIDQRTRKVVRIL